MLAGIYDPAGPGRMLFAFFAAMAETERETIREARLEGLDAAAPKGNHGGRPHHARRSSPSSRSARASRQSRSAVTNVHGQYI
ncbi:recombinase family protein [Nonomuraea sp. NPDC049152]|uniref:recombinase family protein n=1 Tax=Nonomuraea sp. NPDC049152 TaxID=3154350 RepID=UPI0033E1F488